MDQKASSFVVELLMGASHLGLDISSLLRELGSAFGERWLAEGTHNADAYCWLWDRLMREAGGGAVALRLGENPFFRMNRIYELALAGTSGLQALHNISSHWPIEYHGSNWQMATEAQDVTATYTSGIPEPYDVLDTLFHVFSVLTVIRTLCARTIAPVEASFRFAEPEFAAECYAVFRSPIGFGAQANTLVFERKALERPVGGSDAALQAYLLGSLNRGVSASSDRMMLPEVLREVLGHRMGTESIGIEAVARTLHLSVSTLQRRLKACGTSYRNVLEKVREERCLALLRRPEMEIKAIAQELGYSDVANFHHACRRWFGATPAEIRAGGLPGTTARVSSPHCRRNQTADTRLDAKGAPLRWRPPNR